ncbi:MAG: hypothetical protein DYH12_25120 [Sorangiineae bacterium PRO1]|nr:hypothetical protein [Sorangiineae bacterium PRO1]
MAPQPRPRRGSRSLRSAAKTIQYELDMFLLASRCLQAPNAPAVANLLLEALLLHTRVLRDFFRGVGRNDDVLVTDFLPVKPRFRLRHLRSSSTKKRLDKLLAHASFSRPRLGKKWPVGPIQQEIVQAWLLFMDRLEKHDPKARAWFPRYAVEFETDGQVRSIGVRPPRGK